MSGLPDSTATFDGFWNDSLGFATHGAYQAAVDGVARKWYFYPNTSAASVYLFGTGFFDASFDFSVSDVVKMSGTYSAATPTGSVG